MKLAGHKLPTLCDFVAEMEVLMTEWEMMSIDVPETSGAIAKGLEKIVEYYKRMDKCSAYVIAMCTSQIPVFQNQGTYPLTYSSESVLPFPMDSTKLGRRISYGSESAHHYDGEVFAT